MSEEEKPAHAQDPSTGSTAGPEQKMSSSDQTSPPTSAKDIEQAKPFADDGPPDGGLKAWMTVAGA
jgi:hypothetical protein